MKTDAIGTVARNGRLALPVTVVKRDGSTVAFDGQKIHAAVYACLTEDCGYGPTDSKAIAEGVRTRVENVLLGAAQPSVERVQDLVEQQLMACGEHEAAKQYILYREQRRQVREAEKPIDPAAVQLFREAGQHFTGLNRHLQQVQAFDKFSRFQWDKGRREVWPESVGRVLRYARKHMDTFRPGALSEETWQELHTGLLRMEALPSLRLVQMAGPALDRCQSGVYNCAFLFPDSPRACSEDLYLLMQGCGVGFSVEYQHAVDKWPRIRKPRNIKPEPYVIGDAAEGWCDALKHGMERWLDGGNYAYNYDEIRPAAAILRTKGGRASGSGPLRDLLDFARARFQARAGERLTSLDLFDVTCMQHRIVQMGGVRRASGWCGTDLDDPEMRTAKSGLFWKTHPQRDQANVSAIYDEKPTALDFMEEWLSLGRSGSGERGILNTGSMARQLPKRRKRARMRTNPCVTGETLVYTADGRGSVPIQTLADEGRDVPVFCLDEQRNLTVRYMRNPRVTGYEEPVLKVTLDDGCTIRCTRKHRFMLRDGAYREAMDLRPGDSLRLVTRYTPEAVDSDSQSRADLYVGIQAGMKSLYFEHTLVAGFHAGREVGKDEHVHHIDENRLNNAPGNLEIRAAFAHLSEHSAAEENPRYSGTSNEELLRLGQHLTRSLGRRFSLPEWLEFADDNDLPQNFSAWRKSSLGTIAAFARRCAVLEGFVEYGTADPRAVRTYKSLLAAGLDAEIVDGAVFVHKECEHCRAPFTVEATRREQGYCSVSCGVRTAWTDPAVREKQLARQAEAFDARRHVLREKQLEVYTELKNGLGRLPLKKEWVARCKLQGVSVEICRQPSPFINWQALEQAAAGFNHRVVSVVEDGHATVYNGTVDECHNYLAGGWDGGLTSKGRRREWWVVNANCGEVYLKDRQFCNLSVAVLRPGLSREEVRRRVRLAAIWGTIQTTMTRFNYLSDQWRLNCEEERLMGVDILGHLDCELTKPGAAGLPEFLALLKQDVVDTNTALARAWEINPSAAVTCNKPSGDSSCLVDTAAGFKDHHGKFYLRRIRLRADNPVARVLMAAGVPYTPDYNKTDTLVFDFPCRAPEGALILGERTALEQLEHWKTYKLHYTEHNPSVSIYVRPEEWLATGHWVYENWDHVGGLSFFPFDGGVYPLAPYQTLTEDEYRERAATFPEIDWAELLRYEFEDMTTLAQTVACVGGACEMA